MSDSIEIPGSVAAEFVRRWTAKDTIGRVGEQLHVREVEALRHLLFCLGVEEDLLDAWQKAWQYGAEDSEGILGLPSGMGAIGPHTDGPCIEMGPVRYHRRNNRIDK